MKSFRAIFAAGAILAAGLAIVAESQTTPPAPTVDRVFFPADYQNWQVLYTIDRPDNKQQRVIYGNDLAAAVIRGGEWDYPQGSILVMETWPTVQDDQGNPVRDENGRFVKMGDTYAGTVFVSRKGPQLGGEYGPNPNPDRTYTSITTTPPFHT